MAPPEANATSFKKKGDKKGKREQKAPIKDNDKKSKNFKKKQWKSKKIPSGKNTVNKTRNAISVVCEATGHAYVAHLSI